MKKESISRSLQNQESVPSSHKIMSFLAPYRVMSLFLTPYRMESILIRVYYCWLPTKSRVLAVDFFS
jgi:hypothetical protein